MSVDYHLIGKRISEHRRAIHRTQENLAECLGVSVGYISQIERGVTKVSLDTLSNICSFLGCDLAELLSNTTYQQDRYLYEEFFLLYSEMQDNQKKLLLEIASAILKYE